MRYEQGAVDVIRSAARYARTLGHGFVGTAHLLLALTQQPDRTGQLLHSFGVRESVLRDLTVLSYGLGQEGLPLHQSFTADTRKLLEGASWEARHGGCRQIGSDHILLAMARLDGTTAWQLLKLCQVDLDMLLKLFNHCTLLRHLFFLLCQLFILLCQLFILLCQLFILLR